MASAPPMNVIEKILCHHAVGLSQPYVRVGDVLCVKADWTIASELTFQAMDTMHAAIGRPPLHRPDRFWLALDHTVDPRVNHLPKQKALIEMSTNFAKTHGLTDFQPANTTIMHTEFARKRAQPGQIVIGADSHTCSAGGMGAFAAGLGAGDVVMPLVTGQTWFKVPEVCYIEFVGAPSFGIGGKDVILHILGELKRNTVAFERAVYYGGAGLKYLSDDARFAVANMSTEFGGIAGVFQADAITQRVLEARDSHFDEALFFEPDEGCNYATHHVINLADVKPLIALYPSPDNCVSVQEKLGMKLDGCFIGACTTTQEDLILGAMVLQQAMLEGKRPSANGNRRVTPGSLEIIDRLKELGLIRIYEEAGFTVGVPSCSFCVGIGADVAGEDEVWLSSQNRNFRNRMGKGSIGNLSSAAVVAASSFDMEVVNPLPYLDKINKEDFDRYRNWVEPDASTPSPAKTTKSYTVVEPNPVLASGDDDASVQQAKEQAAVAELEAALPLKFSGKVQKFGDNIDTDAVIPAQFMGLNKSSPLWPAECETELDVLAAKSFAYVRPEFPQKVKEGFNIIVAGTAFGSGSSREEAAICLKAVGVQAVIAKSFAYIYARNQPNNALLGIVVTDEKFHELAAEGEEVTVDLRNRVVSVKDHQVAFSLTQLEEAFLNGGGLKTLFKQHKADLFRAAMGGKAPKVISSGGVGCGDGCGGETAATPSW
ncbi:putative aconitate hydratase [Phytophthora idaei]|nr:putative aconitate hydratase [Phytophthora idaei]KAG3167015.1 putative aconitate hydratase [Phytophthora idaei]KAG3246664.1 putative aconitate hydratase [Phytophthora idaei]